MSADKPLRDARGRFAKGHGPIGGRRPAIVEKSYVSALIRTCQPERFARVVERVLAAAEGGDLQAAKLLFSYLVPQETVLRLAGRLGGEFRVAGRSPGQVDEEMASRLLRLMKERREYEKQMRRGEYSDSFPDPQRSDSYDGSDET